MTLLLLRHQRDADRYLVYCADRCEPVTPVLTRKAAQQHMLQAGMDPDEMLFRVVLADQQGSSARDGRLGYGDQELPVPVAATGGAPADQQEDRSDVATARAELFDQAQRSV